MKAILDDVLFSIPGALRELRQLFALADRRGHRLELSEPEGGAFALWLASLGKDDRDDYTGFLDSCLTLEDQEPARRVVQVTHLAESEWRTDPPTLTLADAIALMDRPFRIVVENDDSDAQFLFCVMAPEWLKELQRALDGQRRKAVLEHRGGIPNMTPVVRRATDAPAEQLTMWLLFDSDARYPGTRGEGPEKLAMECRANGVPFHCLTRRAIENYLPRRALEAWADDEGQQRATRRATLQVFFGPFMSERPERRHYFNMKGGFQKDARHAQEADHLYDGLPPEDKRALNSGFSKTVRTWFRNDLVASVDLREDGSWDEVEEFSRELIALLR